MVVILMFEYDFMKNALLAVLLITPILGILGTMVVNNKMAFFSDALGHSALAGIGIGVVLGLTQPLWAMIAFALVFSAAIIIVKNTNNSSMDTIIGVFSSTGIAIGIVLLSINSSFSKYSNFLIGDILGITPNEIILLAIVFICVIIIWIFIFNNLLIVSLDNTFGVSRGVNTKFLEIIFTSIIAVVVTISIKWVGILIINSLLVLPAASSRNIARNMRQYHAISVLLAITAGISGLIISFYFNTSTGATIVLISAILYFITLIFRKR